MMHMIQTLSFYSYELLESLALEEQGSVFVDETNDGMCRKRERNSRA